MKLFGNLFDFNGDGKTDGAEWMLGMHLMEGDREERSSRAGERGIEIEIEIGGEDADDDLRERLECLREARDQWEALEPEDILSEEYEEWEERYLEIENAIEQAEEQLGE